VIVFRLEGERPPGVPPVAAWVYVDDLEEHFSRVKGAGAAIVEELHQLPGSSLYVAEDPEGNRWTFLQARPTML
jgi:predicted enzyme related to lactoylglutathione lyase